MELSPFLRHLPRMFRVGTGLDLETCRISPTWILWVVVSCCTTLAINLSRVRPPAQGVRFENIYEAIAVVTTLTDILLLYYNRKWLTELKKQLFRPFIKPISHTTFTLLVTDEYRRMVSKYGKLISFTMVLTATSLLVKPLIVSRNFASDQEVALPMGWMPRLTQDAVLYSLFYGVCYLATATAVTVTAAVHNCWYLLFLFSSLQVTARLKLLVLEVEAIDNCHMMVTSEQQRHRRAVDSLREIVREHVDVIRHVRLIDRSFRGIVLTNFNNVAVVTALVINLLIDDWCTWGMEMIAHMVILLNTIYFFYLTNEFGQMITDQSERLYLALNSTKWSDQPAGLQRDQLIVKSVASRPLHITAGGIKPLGMRSFHQVVSAIYSYANFLVTIRNK